MIKSLLSNSEILLAAIPGEDGEIAVRHAELDGRRIVKVGEGVPSRLAGPTRVSLFSLESYFEQANLPAASVKLLPLVARRHVNAELVFDDTAYRLRARSTSKHERTITADIAAMPERDLEDAVSSLPMRERPCLQMVPFELSIAALVHKVTTEPVMVFWERGGMLISLLVVSGMVQARMRERVTDQDREAVIGRAETGLKTNANRAGQNRETYLTLYMGDLSGRERRDGEKASQALEEKIARLYRKRRKIPKDAVLRDPELYGLPFVPQDWNFLEADYRTQVLSWRYARPAAAVAGLAGLVIALYGGLQHLQALGIASEFDRSRAELNESLADLERIRPSDEAMASVRDRLQVQQESFNEVRLDRMLDWLTHLVPEGVVIRALQMEPVPLPRKRTPGAPTPYAPGQKPFEVKMEIVLADTVLDTAEASAAEVVKRLSQRLHMVDSRLKVPAPEPGVRRNVVLVVRAQAKAVNFS